MTFNKSVLAVAVAMALSAPVFAVPATGQINLKGSGQAGTGSYTLDGIDGVAFTDSITIRAGDTEATQDPAHEAIPGYDVKSLSLTGDFDSIDVELQSIGTLTGDTANAGAALVLDNVATDSAYIETNGAIVAAGITGNAINIIGSDLSATTTDEAGNPVAPHLIYNNGGEISAMAGHGIDIQDSSLTGNIVNGSEAGFNDDGDYQDNTAGKITGGGVGNAAINIANSSLTGDIVNNAGSQIGNPGSTGINISAEAGKTASFTGNIINAGAVEAVFEETDADSGTIITQGVSAKPAGMIGDITLSAADAAGELEAGQLAFNGAINNAGTMGNIHIGEGVLGEIAINLEDDSTTGALVTNAVTTVNQNGGVVDGDVDNDGIFNLNSGIIDGINVKNNGVFNQEGGFITAAVSNEGTFNFNGGTIAGAVDNTGAFNVNGKQAITGAYAQTNGQLTVGLQQNAKIDTAAQDIVAEEYRAASEAGFSATSFNISGGKVLVDLKGDVYVANNSHFFVLNGDATGSSTYLDGNIDDLGLLNSELVTITDVTSTLDGVILTFGRKTFAAQTADLAKSGQFSGQQGANVARMAGALQKLDAIAATNPAVARLLNNISGSAESFTELLPDVSGATVAAAQGAAGQSTLQVSSRARGLASGDVLDNTGVWVQGIVSKGQQDNRHNDAFDTKSHGFVLGADTELNSGLVVGGAYSFISSESETANSRTDSDYHMATAYGAQAMGQVLLDGQVYYAWGDNDGQRNIGTTSSYDSSLFGARVGAGYQYDIAPATRLVPTLSLEASRLSVDGYTENGTGALTIGKQDFDRLELGLSTELSKDFQLSHAMVTPSVMLGAFHDFEAEAQASTVAFAAAPAETFTVSGRDPEKSRYVAGVGLDIMSGENLTVSAEYNYNWNGDGFDANAGALKFRWDF